MTAALPFADRRDAGRQLARALLADPPSNPVILALPRGGVPVAYEIARRLHAPLGLLLVRKIGAPGYPEYGIGAVLDGSTPSVVIDEGAARATGADKQYIEETVQRELAEIERRKRAYGTPAMPSLAGRSVILVDDGIATGATVSAALRGLAHSHADRIVLAVPVAPSDIVAWLGAHCDRVVCLASPEPFMSVGSHYRDFSQLEDAEVVKLLALSGHAVADEPHPAR